MTIVQIASSTHQLECVRRFLAWIRPQRAVPYTQTSTLPAHLVFRTHRATIKDKGETKNTEVDTRRTLFGADGVRQT